MINPTDLLEITESANRQPDWQQLVDGTAEILKGGSQGFTFSPVSTLKSMMDALLGFHQNHVLSNLGILEKLPTYTPGLALLTSTDLQPINKRMKPDATFDANFFLDTFDNSGEAGVQMFYNRAGVNQVYVASAFRCLSDGSLRGRYNIATNNAEYVTLKFSDEALARIVTSSKTALPVAIRDYMQRPERVASLNLCIEKAVGKNPLQMSAEVSFDGSSRLQSSRRMLLNSRSNDHRCICTAIISELGKL